MIVIYINLSQFINKKAFTNIKGSPSPRGQIIGEKSKDLMFKTEDIHIKLEKLEAKIAELKVETNLQRGIDRKRIAELEEYIRTKDNGRCDSDWLSVKLKKELLKRKRGMDYKEVLNFFHFSAQEAYRLMDRTVKNFPFDVEIEEIKNSNKRKKVIISKY